MGLGIPIIDNLLGLGRTVVERVLPDKNKAQDQRHDRVVKQIDATIEGERNTTWTPRKILMLVFAIPVTLQLAVKPSVEWVCAVFGHPITLPGIDIGPALKFLIGLLGLDFTS